MKKADVKIGATYAVKVSGKIQPVRIDREAGTMMGGWYGANMDTGRQVRIRTAGKLRKVIQDSNSTLGARV